MGKTKTAKELAEAILNKLAPTAEDAVALTGKPREEYLKALEVVHGNKAARIPQVVSENNAKGYHGTPQPFEGDKIELSKAGKTSGVNTGHSFSITSDPRLAGEFADFGIDTGNNIMPVRYNTSNLEVTNAGGRQIKNSIRSKIVEHAAENKKDGVLFKNLLDDPNEYIQNPADVAFITNPKTVRSEFAAFDPRFKNSPLLMAGAAGAALTLGGAQEAEAGKAKSAKELAEAILNKLAPTAEDAVALTGKPREEYLQALDTVFGDVNTRSWLPTTEYHGGPKGIESFNPSERGTFGPGVYSTSNKKEALKYKQKAGDSGELYELKTPGKEQYFDASKGDITKVEGFDKLSKEKQMDVRYSHDARAAFLKEQGYAGVAETKGKDKYKNTFDPANIRSVNAAFDPRFKNSPLLMAGAAGAALTLGGQQEAEAGTLKNLGKVMVKDTAKPLGKTIVVNEGQNAAQAIQKANAPVPQAPQSIGDRVISALGAPQRKMVNSIAGFTGVPQNQEDAEPVIHDLVQAGAERLGLPENTAMSALKAGTVAGASMFADPLSLIPGGAIAKQLGKAAPAVGPATKLVENLSHARMPGYAHGGVVRGYSDGGMVEPEFDVFDMSGPTPVLGSVPASQVQAAVQSGRFALPVNKPVPVMSPDGELGEIPAEQAADAFKQGFKFATPDMEKFSNRGLAAGALGAVQGVTAGLAGAGLGALGEAMPGSILPTRDDLNKLEQYNPSAYTAGEVVGTVGSMVLPTGVGGLALKAGRAAEAAVGATTAVGRVGSAATKAAVENMVLASGNETAKIFMGKPDLSVETALSNIGFAGAIGGGIGGAFGAVPELWKVAKGNKLASMLNGVKAATEGKPTAELTKLDIAVAPELEAALSDSPVAQRTFQELMQSDSSSAKELTAMAAKFSDDLGDSAARVIGRTADDVTALSTAETGTAIKETLERNLLSRYEPIAKSYEALEAKFGTAPLMPEIRDSMSGQLQQIVVNDGLLKSKAAAPLLKLVVETMEDLPKQANAQDLRLLAQNLREANPFGSPGYQVAKKVNSVLSSGMDNTLMGAAGAEGAEAAAMFKATQAEYRALKGTIEDLNDYLHAGKARGTQSFVQAIKGMDPETVARRLSQEKTQLVDLLTAQFPEIGAAVKQYSYDKLLKASISEGKLNIRSLARRIEKMEPETRAKLFTPEQLDKLAAIRTLQDKIPKNMNPSGTAKTIEAIMSRPAATLAGAIMGGMGGGLGALAASLGLKEVKDSFKMGMLRFLASDAPTNAAALKQAMGMAAAVEKGQRALDTSVKAVFGAKNGTAVKIPDTSKLKELVEEVTQDESRLLNIGGELGHYLPDQAAALGMATVRNIRYLAAQRPSTAPLSPLDGMRQVSDADEAKYERALEIAQQPLIILDGVKEGRINPQDLQHLAQMYPALRAQMGDKLQTELIEAIGRGETIPYATKIGLSAFLGQPLESSLQPQAIQAAQPQPAAMPQQPQGKPARKSNSLPKLPVSYQTPGQSRSRARLER